MKKKFTYLIALVILTLITNCSNSNSSVEEHLQNKITSDSLIRINYDFKNLNLYLNDSINSDDTTII